MFTIIIMNLTSDQLVVIQYLSLLYMRENLGGQKTHAIVLQFLFTYY